MTRPIPDTWEPITTHPEGGWLAPGYCGWWHLVGDGWSWWECPYCKKLTRHKSVNAITKKQAAMLAHFYPDAEEPA